MAKPLIGINYESWWGSPVPWGAISHWGSPSLGLYDSSDTSVLTAHAARFVAMGVDFVLVDWSNNIDPGTHLDNPSNSTPIMARTDVLFDTWLSLGQAPKIAILLGANGGAADISSGALQQQVDRVAAHYLGSRAAQYQNFKGKPLLVIYTNTPTQFPSGPPGWTDSRFTVRWMTGFLDDQPSLVSGGQSLYHYWSFIDRDPIPTYDGADCEAVTVTSAYPGRAPVFLMTGQTLDQKQVVLLSSDDGLSWRYVSTLVDSTNVLTPMLARRDLGSPSGGPTGLYGLYSPEVISSTRMILGGWRTSSDPNTFTAAIDAMTDPTTIVGPDKLFRSDYSGGWGAPNSTPVLEVVGYSLNDPSVVELTPGTLTMFMTAIQNAYIYPAIYFNQHSVGRATSVDGGITWAWQGIVLSPTQAGDGQGPWAPSAVIHPDGTLWLYYHTGTSDFSLPITWRQQMAGDGSGPVGPAQRLSFTGIPSSIYGASIGWFANIDVMVNAPGVGARMYYAQGVVASSLSVLTVDPALPNGWLASDARGRLSGATFMTQWNKAISLVPQLVLINGWNEFWRNNTADPPMSDQYTAELSNDLEDTVELGAGPANFVAAMIGRFARSMSAGAGAFAFTGNPVSMSVAGSSSGAGHGVVLSAGAGAFAFGGNWATLVGGTPPGGGGGGGPLHLGMAAGVGAFPFAGQDAILRWSPILIAETGAFPFAGVSVGLREGKRLGVDAGAFAFDGQDVTFIERPGIQALRGAFPFSGKAAILFPTPTSHSFAYTDIRKVLVGDIEVSDTTKPGESLQAWSFDFVNVRVAVTSAGAAAPDFTVMTALSNNFESTVEDHSIDANTQPGPNSTAFDLYQARSIRAVVYMGLDTMFNWLAFMFHTGGASHDVIWEYSVGDDAWADLSGIRDSTRGFSLNGAVSWDMPIDWALSFVNYIEKFWVRARPSVPPVVAASVYSIQPFALDLVRGVETRYPTIDEAWLLEIDWLTGTGYYATQGVDRLIQPYEFRIEGDIQVSRTMADTAWGAIQVSELTAVLRDGGGELSRISLNNSRGRKVIAKKYRPTTGQTITEFVGEFTGRERGQGRVTIHARDLDTSLFQRPIPGGNNQIDLIRWPKAVDVGKLIPLVNGNVPRVPLPLVRDDRRANEYDYLAGYDNEAVLNIPNLYRQRPGTTESGRRLLELMPHYHTPTIIQQTQVPFAHAAVIPAPASYQVTFDHNCAGLHLALVVFIDSTHHPVTKVRYGGKSLTKLGHVVAGISIGAFRTETWVMMAPSQGTHQLYVEINPNADGGPHAPTNGIVTALTISGVDQSMEAADFHYTNLRQSGEETGTNTIEVPVAVNGTGYSIVVGTLVSGSRPERASPEQHMHTLWQEGLGWIYLTSTSTGRIGPSESTSGIARLFWKFEGDPWVTSAIGLSAMPYFTVRRGGGFTWARVTAPQLDTQFNQIPVFADIETDPAHRNPAGAVERVLTNDVWGLDQVVDTSDFIGNKFRLDEIGDLYADFAIVDSAVQAQDLLRQILMIYAMSLGKGVLGFTLRLPSTTGTVSYVVEDGPGEGDHSHLSIGPRSQTGLGSLLSRWTLKYRQDMVENTMLQTIYRLLHPSGQEKVEENKCVQVHRTADKMLDLHSKILLFGDESVPVSLTQDARHLTAGDLIEVSSDELGYDRDILQLTKVDKNLGVVSGQAVGWNPAITEYRESVPYPPRDAGIGSVDDFSNIPPDPVTNFRIRNAYSTLIPPSRERATVQLSCIPPSENVDHLRFYYRQVTEPLFTSGPVISRAAFPAAGAEVNVVMSGLEANAPYEYTVSVVNQYGLLSAGDPVLEATTPGQEPFAPDLTATVI